ncbi:MAG TPA: hypothetical protein ENI89_05975 [Desulfobulbus sp.]|nr:hypothetical protein [Desulfobulbus sp.]
MKKTDTARSTAGDLRKFGLLVGLVFLALGVIFFRQGKSVQSLLALPGLLLVVLAMVRPLLLRRVHRVWMAGSTRMGSVMTAVLLTLVYLLVITPLALAARLMGMDLLHRRPDPARQSYWRPREPGSQEPADCEHQY